MRPIEGIAWDHPRAMDPLLLAAAHFEEATGIRVSWSTRSLAGFEETSIDSLATAHDLIAIDHPFMGAAHAAAALKPVEDVVSVELLDELQRSSVGCSWDSYEWASRHWAVPIDAAAQVSAFDAAGAAMLGGAVPNWHEVVDLARETPGRVAIALNPTHLLLTALTVCHALTDRTAATADLTPSWWSDASGADIEIMTEALAVLVEIRPHLHPMSADSDPIAVLDRMTSTDEIAYVPAVFGYCSYARSENVARPVMFGDVPGWQGQRRGGVLGGVGLAVSNLRPAHPAVPDFLAFVAGEDFQATGYSEVGGQPAHRMAWTSEQVNTWTPNFFAPTLPSLDAAFVRPRSASYPDYQRDGGAWLHQAWMSGATPRTMAEGLSELWM